MITELDPVELIRKARYAFRGTDKAFYQHLLMHSKRIFGKSGLYRGSSRGGEQTTSVTLNPLYALIYARRANKAALYREEFLRSHYGIKNLGPIVLLIDIEKYKDRISKGLEWEHPGFEYEILGLINEGDIQILDEDHINNLELYCMKNVLASASLIFPGRAPSNLEQVLTNLKKELRNVLVKNSSNP